MRYHVGLRSIPIISLCTGAGMLDVGVQAGLRALGGESHSLCYCERESHAQAAIVARIQDSKLGDAPVWSSIDDFPSDIFRPYMAGGMVIAGFPCPPVSCAGKRLGADDERWLWPQVLRVAHDTGAEWLFIENVRGLLSAEGKPLDAGSGEPVHKLFGGILRDLANGGWDAEWCVFSAAEVGASHRRERVFLLANRENGDRGLHAGWRDEGERADDLGGKGNMVAHRSGRQGEPTNRHLPKRGRTRDAEQVGMGGSELAGTVGNAEGDGREGGGAGRRQGTTVQAGAGLSRRAGRGLATACGSMVNAEPFGWDAGRAGLHGQAEIAVGGTACHPELRREDLPLFAPARNDFWGWVRVLNADPSLVPALPRAHRGRVQGNPQEPQSPVRGVPDGLAEGMEQCDLTEERADRLRLCGNGVVWPCAAAAFW